MASGGFVRHVVPCVHDFVEHVPMQVYSLLAYQHEMRSVDIDDDWDQFVVAAAVVAAKTENDRVMNRKRRSNVLLQRTVLCLD